MHCVYLLFCFSDLLRYMEKFEKKFDMDMSINFRRSHTILDRMMLTFETFVQHRVHKLHPVYNILRRRLRFFFKRHLVVLSSSISVHFEDFVGRTTRKRLLRCLYAKHPDQLSQVYDLRRSFWNCIQS